jgi:hypothetical protein
MSGDVQFGGPGSRVGIPKAALSQFVKSATEPAPNKRTPGGLDRRA